LYYEQVAIFPILIQKYTYKIIFFQFGFFISISIITYHEEKDSPISSVYLTI